jgi:hypothetical protein
MHLSRLYSFFKIQECGSWQEPHSFRQNYSPKFLLQPPEQKTPSREFGKQNRLIPQLSSVLTNGPVAFKAGV